MLPTMRTCAFLTTDAASVYDLGSSGNYNLKNRLGLGHAQRWNLCFSRSSDVMDLNNQDPRIFGAMEIQALARTGFLSARGGCHVHHVLFLCQSKNGKNVCLNDKAQFYTSTSVSSLFPELLAKCLQPTQKRA